jgi:hypothetical protein
MSTHDSLIRAGLDIKGTFALASAPATKPAMAPDGARYTAFTGELVRILEEGLNNQAEVITLEEIYQELKQELKKAGLPEPQRANFQEAGNLRIARNRRYQLSPDTRIEALERRVVKQGEELKEILTILRTRGKTATPMTPPERIRANAAQVVTALGVIAVVWAPIQLLRYVASSRSPYTYTYETVSTSLLVISSVSALISLLALLLGKPRPLELILGDIPTQQVFWISVAALLGTIGGMVLFPEGYGRP